MADDCLTSLCGAFDEFSAGPNNCLKGVKWAPDGSCLLTASEDQRLRIFELPGEVGAATGGADTELQSVVDVHEGGAIYDYCWYPAMSSAEPSSCCFLATSRDHPIHLWDAYTGQLRASYSAYDHLDEVVSAHSVCFDPSGARAYCGFERAIRIFDVSRPGRECELRRTSPTRKSRDGLRGIISCFAFAPDYSGLYAAGSYTGTIGLYVENSPALICALDGHAGGVTQLAFSHDGLQLFSGARRDGAVLCWDVRNTCRVLATFERAAPTNQRIGFCLSSDSRALISSSQDGRVLAFDASRPEEPPAVWLTYNDATNDAAIHPTHPLLAVAVGERRFPFPSAAAGGDAGASEGEGEGDAAAPGAAGANGFSVWRLPAPSE